jgi:hypothetical protein
MSDENLSNVVGDCANDYNWLLLTVSFSRHLACECMFMKRQPHSEKSVELQHERACLLLALNFFHKGDKLTASEIDEVWRPSPAWSCRVELQMSLYAESWCEILCLRGASPRSAPKKIRVPSCANLTFKQ